MVGLLWFLIFCDILYYFPMKKEIMEKRNLLNSLMIKDLSDSSDGVHAVNIVVDKVVNILNSIDGWPEIEVRRSSPITTVLNNFDNLNFPLDNISRSSVYTRYVAEDIVLRTHSSAMIPSILKEKSISGVDDFAVVCPGICFRRDIVDKKHTGEPHQMDIWRIKRDVSNRIERKELRDALYCIAEELFPDAKIKENETNHPYTKNGLEIEIMYKDNWLEIMECGEVSPIILEKYNFDKKEYSGLAMGFGLDRLVMILKGIDDIRVLRSKDPRIQKQMNNLEKYKNVSNMPPISYDISFSVDNDYVEEDVCEKIKNAFGENIEILEEIQILKEFSYNELPQKAIERLGIKSHQKNILARMVLRSQEKTLTKEETNIIRDNVYRIVNESETDGYLKYKK